MKKLISCVLVIALLLTVAVSCGNDDTGEQNPHGVETDPPNSTDDDEFIRDDIPADLDFEGLTVNILYRTGALHQEFESESLNGDIINDALYYRNLAVEERLGVVLSWIGMPANEIVTTAQNAIYAGSKDYDILAPRSWEGATMTMNGMLQNLLDYPVIDFDKPWWPDSLVKNVTIKDNLYFATGDISTNLLHMMHVVIFNVDMLVNYNLEDPYELVLSGSWTLDKFTEMASAAYLDLNGNSLVDIEDQFGFVQHRENVDAFFYGAGLKTTELSSDGLPVISPLFNSEKTTNLIDKLLLLFKMNGASVHAVITDSPRKIFAANRALFCPDSVDRTYAEFGDADFEYGVVPTPKYDEAQSDYITSFGFPYTMYGISKGAKSSEAAAAVLECMASEAYRRVTPALFEVSMKIKYSSHETESKMYDIIRNGIYFDFGRVYTTPLYDLPYTMYRNCLASGNNTFASSYASSESWLQNALNAVIKVITG